MFINFVLLNTVLSYNHMTLTTDNITYNPLAKMHE